MKKILIFIFLLFISTLVSCESGADVKTNELNLDNIVLKDLTFDYDGEPKYLYFEGNLPNGVTFEWVNNYQTEPGTYEVTLKFIKDGETIKTLKANLVINGNNEDNTPDVSNITFSDASFVYDGEIKSISFSGNLPNGVTFKYENNNQKEVGTYTVKLKLIYNEEVIKELQAELTITENQEESSHSADLPWV